MTRQFAAFKMFVGEMIADFMRISPKLNGESHANPSTSLHQTKTNTEGVGVEACLMRNRRRCRSRPRSRRLHRCPAGGRSE